MLHAVIMKFPVSIIDEQSQTFFLHLVVCLANDRDNRVRSMTGTVIKLLVGRVSPRSLQSILEFSRSWYLGDKPHLWSAAAQVNEWKPQTVLLFNYIMPSWSKFGNTEEGLQVPYVIHFFHIRLCIWTMN